MFTGRKRQGLRNGVNEISCRIGRTGRVGNDGRAFSFIDWTDDGKIQVITCNRRKWYKLFVQLTSPQKDLVRILKQSGQIVPDFLKPLPDGTYKGNKTPRVTKHTSLFPAEIFMKGGRRCPET